MHTTPLLIALSLSLALVACARQSGPPGMADEDGESCASPNHGKKVYIDVTYDASGMPSASPDECKVSNGTDIVWRTPKDVGAEFDIDFEAESVAGPGAPKKVRSQKSDSRQKVKMTSDNKVSRYKYAIEANGKRVDPAVIIER